MALGPVEDEDSYRKVLLFSRNVASGLSKLSLVSSDILLACGGVICTAEL